LTLVFLVAALIVLAIKWRDVTLTLTRPQVALLCLVVVMLVFALAVPETRLLLPLVDAVGWDVFTILVAIQLGHQMTIAYRLCGALVLRVVCGLAPSGARHAYYVLRSGAMERFSAPWWSIALFGARVALPVVVWIPGLLFARR